MSELSGLNEAIIELNELYSVCTDDEQSEQLLTKRDELDTQATELANKIIMEGTEELDGAITALSELTESAVSAKKEIDDIATTIAKTASAIEKATNAIVKVAALIATL